MLSACSVCGTSVASLKAYVQHYQIHTNVHNIRFPCPILQCKVVLASISSLKSHITRYHKKHSQAPVGEKYRHAACSLQCPDRLCGAMCSDLYALILHLKGHISEGKEIVCPFENCSLKYTVKSSFTAHLSRSHKNWDYGKNEHIYFPANENAVDSQHEAMEISEASDIDVTSCFEDGESTQNLPDCEDKFLKNLALFYLKLQAKFLLPASTIKLIVEEMANINQLGNEFLKTKISSSLRDAGVTCGIVDVEQLVDDVLQNDLFSKCVSASGPMRSDYLRKQYYKKEFRYVAPVDVCLGRDANGNVRSCHYVPVLETLTNLFLDKTVVEQYESPLLAKPGVLSDFTDGSAQKTNDFFGNHPEGLKIIIFQDGYETVNPLGSAKMKHKLLGVYFTLGNYHPHFRSTTAQMQLALLCREKDCKTFGLEKVFSRMLRDLKELELKGVELSPNKFIKGTVVFIAGDNLGSHFLGGFSENFSTGQFFCRYCTINRDGFVNSSVPWFRYPRRSKTNYQQALEYLKEHPDVGEYEGIKSDCVFNQLKYYHVCKPGLPPCIGHDLFEGVVDYDIALCLNHFIKVEKWFTLTELNRRIEQFKYSDLDASSKPTAVNKKLLRLGGKATQNWCFLRLLPILLSRYILNKECDKWKMCLLLRKVVEYVCAPSISPAQIAYMNVHIESYLEIRLSCFPDVKLRPKHHYLSHYPELTMEFGPLIRLWTLRFESKHCYFKRCARFAQNFKNITSTLSERHQLLQAYQMNGTLFSPRVEQYQAIAFCSDVYSVAIEEAVRPFNFPEGTLVSHEIQIYGTNYKKGMILLIKKASDGLVIGEIVLTLSSAGRVYFLVKLHRCDYAFELDLYYVRTVKPSEMNLKCVAEKDILDYAPLASYREANMQFLPLKHAFVDNPVDG